MLKYLAQKIIQKSNPLFNFDSRVTSKVLLSLSWNKSCELLRGVVVLLLHFKKPKSLLLQRHVRFFNISNIYFGKWVKVGYGAYLSGLGKNSLYLSDNVSIGSYSQIIISTSFNNIGEYIRIGKNVGLGQFASLGGSGGLEIGDNCIIGQYFSCHPENHNYGSLDILIKNQGTTRSPIKIGNNCWIGAKVTVLAGVTIGDDSIIAAGSVVTNSFPTNSVIGGVPAKILKTRE